VHSARAAQAEREVDLAGVEEAERKWVKVERGRMVLSALWDALRMAFAGAFSEEENESLTRVPARGVSCAGTLDVCIATR
jgi:hypothetical protein